MREPDQEQEPQQGVSISAESMLRAGQRRTDALNQENTMLLARTFDLEKALEQSRRQYTQLLAVCPDDVVEKARAAENPVQG